MTGLAYGTQRTSSPAVSLTVLLLGGTCGWFVRDELTEDNNQALRHQLLLETLVRAHRMFAPDDGIGATFVGGVRSVRHLGRSPADDRPVMAPRELQPVPAGLDQIVDDTAAAVATRGALEVVAIGPLPAEDFDTLTGMVAR